MEHQEQTTKESNAGAERVPPQERFAHDILKFDLRAVAAKLAGEHNATNRGHRQIALYKLKQVTAALFCFDKGGSMPQHKADGTVLIQVIEGNITLKVGGEDVTLDAGGLLVLAPGTLHEVLANEETIMLLTVCLRAGLTR